MFSAVVQIGRRISAQAVRRLVHSSVLTWLLAVWFTWTTLGVPLPVVLESSATVKRPTTPAATPKSSSASSAEKADFSLKKSLQDNHIGASRLAGMTTGGSCCSSEVASSDHVCGCSLKKKQSGTCCCSKQPAPFTKSKASCCSSEASGSKKIKTANVDNSKPDTPKTETATESEGDELIPRIISVCGCADEVGGMMVLSHPFDLPDVVATPQLSRADSMFPDIAPNTPAVIQHVELPPPELSLA